MADKIILIDGDVLCYQCFEPRWKNNVNEYGVAIEEYNADTGRFEKKLPTYTPEEDAQYLRESWERFKRHVDELMESLYATDFLMAVDGEGNYRKDIFDLYKNHRPTWRPSEMSRFVPIIRKLAVKEGYAIASDGREADDYLRIWSEECRLVNKEFIIASIDKDLHCIPGLHYNFKKKEFFEVDEAYALKLYHMQLLQGDQVDGIPGLPGIGPKKAEKALVGCSTLEEYQIAVVEAYMDVFGDNWKQHLLANGKLIHIQRHENDWFDLSDWKVVQAIS